MMRFNLRRVPKSACLCLVLLAQSRYACAVVVTVLGEDGQFGTLDTATGNFTQVATNPEGI